MKGEFLDQLPLSDDERAKLKQFGADSPRALLSIRKASPDAFDNFMGQDRMPAIASMLEGQLSDDDRKMLAEPAKAAAPRSFGARLGPPPKQ